MKTDAMVSEEEAREKILGTISPLPARSLSISHALDCFAAQDYLARLPLPVFDNSAMDGYAVTASDCRSGERLRVIGERPAPRACSQRFRRQRTLRLSELHRRGRYRAGGIQPDLCERAWTCPNMGSVVMQRRHALVLRRRHYEGNGEGGRHRLR